jgi:hypothetical protein
MNGHTREILENHITKLKTYRFVHSKHKKTMKFLKGVLCSCTYVVEYY